MLKRRQYPQFCIITPTAYLERYASQSSMHLVLAHLVDTDETYAEFYANRNEYKIMDNGAFELGESYAPDRLIELGKKCNANAIVLPDYPGEDRHKTINAAIELQDQVKDAGFQTMFVPQAEKGNLQGWIASYIWAVDNDMDIIGMSILGIPNALPHIPRAYARVVMTQLLIDRGDFDTCTYHHYLGLNSGPALELPALIEMDALDSCDSSGPVWAGINGQLYSKQSDSYMLLNKSQLPPVDFDLNLTRDESIHHKIQYNIDLTMGLFE